MKKSMLKNLTFHLICTLAILFTLTLCSKDYIVKEGVDKELAEYRKNSIFNIEYQLFFNIPKNRNTKVGGKATISFNYSGEKDLQIDFCGKLSGEDEDYSFIVVNDNKLYRDKGYRYENEHLIIEKKHLLKGDNKVEISFESSDLPLNRREDFLYTLFVPANARYAFPCFDQPDLKAIFSLTLNIPESWEAISNGILKGEKKEANGEFKELYFEKSDLLPTYLFTFTAGDFIRKERKFEERNFEYMYRKSDTSKAVQIEDVLKEISFSLNWLEEYTGISQPFQKYGFVIIPGYQFGGMEHPGAIQFKRETIFLESNASEEDKLKRFKLLAHETSHLWFGDLVTMKWFDDVWTKEVFANFFASKICDNLFNEINHKINFITTYQLPAIKVDRTAGTHPIGQELENLNKAGLLYGNIIYNKAPIMMKNLENKIGEDCLKEGIREYLNDFSFSNATWDDLIICLDKANKKVDVRAFSNSWVKEKGLPTIRIEYNPAVTSSSNIKELIAIQEDPYGRGLVWEQNFYVNNTKIQVEAPITEFSVGVEFDTIPPYLFINSNGDGYGRFVIDALPTKGQYLKEKNIVSRYTTLINIYENYLMKRFKNEEVYDFIKWAVTQEDNEQMISTACSYIGELLKDKEGEEVIKTEDELYQMALNSKNKIVSKTLLKILIANAKSDSVLEKLYKIWLERNNNILGERDYINLSYNLAIAMPDKWREIISLQRDRIKNEDLLKEFDFICRACTPDTLQLKELFYGLLDKNNRVQEPWAAKTLSLLNTSSREPWNNIFIKPGLDSLLEIEKSSGIFFPTDWLSALLSGHKSNDAYLIIKEFAKGIEKDKSYPIALKNKLLQQSFYLYNKYRD